MHVFAAYLLGYILVLLANLPVKAKIPVLLFPMTAPTRTQWICGIGIPLDNLRYEAETTGYVLKAEYFLPETAEQLRTKTRMPFASRKLSSSTKFTNFLATEKEVPLNTKQSLREGSKKVHISSYRWTVYKGLEGLANRMGLSGRACVLKSICETAETPFHYYNGLLGELLYILLTPSSSSDKLSTHSDNEYFQAEHLGRSGANCHKVFKDCPRSLVDHFSDMHHLVEGVMQIMG